VAKSFLAMNFTFIIGGRGSQNLEGGANLFKKGSGK